MENKTVYLNSISTQAPKEHILIRMGYRKGITKLTQEEEAKIDDGIKKAGSLITLRGAYCTFKLKKVVPGSSLLENGLEIKSFDVSSFLDKCKEAVFMAATTGPDIVFARDREVKEGDAVLGLVLDAAASETADAGLDWIQDFLKTQLAKKGRSLTTRFSPGYGDLDISNQKLIYDALKLNEIGITLTDRFLLVPEKSVIAIAGIL